MSVLISGVLKDGTGKPVQGCTIVLKAKRTTDTVIVNTLASENPDEAGRYSMNVEPGRYAVSLFIEGYPPSYAGDITVYADSPPGTLNYFLGAVSEDDLRPDILKRFEDIAAEINRIAEGVRGDSEQIQQAAHDAAAAADDAKKAAGDSAESERNAQRHAQNAEKKAAQTGQDAAAAASARNDAERFASEARKNAEATASDREATKQDARDAEEAAESVRGFVDAHQAVSTRYSVTDLNGYLASLKISGGACHGLYRYLTASGGINWYFLFLAMYESEGKVFTLADRKTVCEKAITLGIFVPFQTNSSYISGQRIVVGNKLFYVNISGISGGLVPDVSTVSRGDFVRTGTLVLECLGNTVKEIPESWQWFFVDIDSSLRYPVAPDSTDSYAALWLACIATFADKAWLLEPSGVAGYSRWDVICRVADNNLISQTGPHNLTRVFQNNRAPGGNQYELYFCQDNAEVYAG
ncbi:TPA: prophage tail fiber N-terminal domain-containing protein, partial [Escherichia coli]